MGINKKWGILITCFLTLYTFAGSDAGKEKSKMILPIHILLEEDAGEDLPGRESNVDYSVYRVGAIWPDWDWYGEQEDEFITPPPAVPTLPAITAPLPTSPKISKLECIAKLLAYFKCNS